MIELEEIVIKQPTSKTDNQSSCKKVIVRCYCINLALDKQRNENAQALKQVKYTEWCCFGFKLESKHAVYQHTSCRVLETPAEGHTAC